MTDVAQMNVMDGTYQLYLYDADNGDLVKVIKGVERLVYKAQACIAHFKEGYAVKVYDGSNCLVYTLGV